MKKSSVISKKRLIAAVINLFIFSGENGLIVENPEDPSCFAEKITEILSDKSLMKKMKKKEENLQSLNLSGTV
ncbi:glycosyltransferase family protein [Neobacillus ginsengisoli]|uniref:Glycosyltransferase involved in cell wall biosynthesis n=1 Tax=Neobacillus ginsengisoli TaxID=904295 RepID=A0ABT9XTP7_9BACI|nr:hypothetical protein [Neobacillus ginsengisoli]MDQ0198923.1 glycosyltransferase involved in cell wall biosynthesis [Neobacillus ginsengisoli]